MPEGFIEILSGGGVAGILGALLFKAMNIIEAKSSTKKNVEQSNAILMLSKSLDNIAEALKEIKNELHDQRSVLQEIRTEQIKDNAVDTDRILRSKVCV